VSRDQSVESIARHQQDLPTHKSPRAEWIFVAECRRTSSHVKIREIAMSGDWEPSYGCGTGGIRAKLLGRYPQR